MPREARQRAAASRSRLARTAAPARWAPSAAGARSAPAAATRARASAEAGNASARAARSGRGARASAVEDAEAESSGDTGGLRVEVGEEGARGGGRGVGVRGEPGARAHA